VLRTFVDLRLASIYDSVKAPLREASGSVLEVGCGNSPYRFLIKNASYTGIDHALAKEFSYKSEAVIYYEGGEFPVESGRFDIVFHTEVLEHVADPERFMESCFRILRPGGTMFFSVPFSYRYHYIPNDYYRYTPATLERLRQRAGFHSISIDPQGTDVTVACHKVISIFFRLTTERHHLLRKAGNLLLCLVFSPIPVIAHVLGWFSLKFGLGSPDDTLDYFVRCRKA
jgi:SAM-dependent methyltransferase